MQNQSKYTGWPWRKMWTVDNLRKHYTLRFIPKKKSRVQVLLSSFCIFLYKDFLPLKSSESNETLQKPRGSYCLWTYLWAKVDSDLLCLWITLQKWPGKVVLRLLWYCLTPVLVESCLIPVRIRDDGHLMSTLPAPQCLAMINWRYISI